MQVVKEIFGAGREDDGVTGMANVLGVGVDGPGGW